MRLVNAFLLIGLLAIGFCSCHRSSQSPTSTEIGSELGEIADLIYSDPVKADSILALLQAHVADSTMWAHLSIFRASAHYRMGDSLGTEVFFDGVVKWCERHPGNDSILSMAWNHRGAHAFWKGNTSEGVSCFKKAYAIMDASPKTSYAIPICINLADIYFQEGRIPEAASLYRQALQLCDSLKERSYLFSIYSGLGSVYSELNYFKKAHQYFSLAEKLVNQEPLTSQQYYYMSLGNCFYFEENYEEAKTVFLKARDQAASLKFSELELKCEANLGEIFLMQDSLAQAQFHIFRADSIKDACQSIDYASQFYVQSLMADLALAQEDSETAKKILNEVETAPTVKSYRYIMLHYKRLLHYLEKKEDWHSAYIVQQKLNVYSDSLQGVQSSNKVMEVELRYGRDKKLIQQELQLTKYKVQSEHQHLVILGGIACFLILLLATIIGILIFRRRTRRHLENQKEKIMALRMGIVRNRVSPHYIFNVLGTILPKLQTHEELNLPINLLIDVLRGNLLVAGNLTVSLAQEIGLVKKFVELHLLTHKNLPRVCWKLDEKTLKSEVRVPAMSLEIPVENALKHAFPEINENCCIEIEAYFSASGDELTLCVKDNGQGFNPGRIQPLERDTGTGLKMISRTFEILNLRNARKASFTIGNRPAPEQGTVVRLTLPTYYDFSFFENG